MNVAIFVPTLVVGILLFNALLWGGLWLWFRSRMAQARVAFASEVAQTGERVVIAPDGGHYAGGTGGFTNVGGSGLLALTDRRVWFRKLTGGVIEVPIASLSAARTAASYRSRRRAGRRFLVLSTKERSELAFSMVNQDRWLSALRDAGIADMAHP